MFFLRVAIFISLLSLKFQNHYRNPIQGLSVEQGIPQLPNIVSQSDEFNKGQRALSPSHLQVDGK